MVPAASILWKYDSNTGRESTKGGGSGVKSELLMTRTIIICNDHDATKFGMWSSHLTVDP